LIIIWKGAISFGLVNIPVSMYVVPENKDVKFNFLHMDTIFYPDEIRYPSSFNLG